MRQATRDNLAKFFYDCGKVGFAVLVIGVVAKKPFAVIDLLVGMSLTMALLVVAYFLDEAKGGA